MGDLVWARIFFFQTSKDGIFSPTYNGVRFLFAALYAIRYIIFHYRSFFSQVFFLQDYFPLTISMQDIFFLKSPISCLKSQMVSP